MKRPLRLSLKFTLYGLALIATLLPLTRLLHKQPAASDRKDWFEEAFLYI